MFCIKTYRGLNCYLSVSLLTLPTQVGYNSLLAPMYTSEPASHVVLSHENIRAVVFGIVVQKDRLYNTLVVRKD